MCKLQRCDAILNNFCSGDTPVEDCLECMEFVTTCDECYSPGSNESIGWYEGSGGRTLCENCNEKEIKK